MSSRTKSTWTPASTALSQVVEATLDKDLCTTCNKHLPKIDENLLKQSLRMKSEVSQANSQKKSLMHLLALNEDFVFPIYSKETMNTRVCGSQLMSATSKLIDEEKQQSIVKKQSELKQNRKLQNCEKFEVASRKREYKKWDFKHAQLADYYLKLTVRHADDLWPKEEHLEKCSNNETATSKESRSGFDATTGLLHGSKGGRHSTSRRLISKDGEEDIPESERVQMAIEKLRKESSNAVLTEIHQIKDRHRQLEALTLTKQRAQVDTTKPTKSLKEKGNKMDKDALRKFLLVNANLQKDLDFNSFKEKTTVKLQRDFNGQDARAYPGGVWKPKWNPSINQTKGTISKSTHPASDASKKRQQFKFIPAKQGDLPPCVFLPNHIQAKTPMESAIRLDQFIKQTNKAQILS